MDSAAHKIIKRENRAQQAFPNLVNGCPKNTNNFSGIDLNNLPGKHIGHGHGYNYWNWQLIFYLYIFIYIYIY